MTWHRSLCTVSASLVFAIVAPAISAEEESPLGWKGSVSAGIALTEGTTDSFGANLDGKLAHRWERDSLTFQATGIFTESDEETTANNQQLRGEYRHDFTDRFFGFNTHTLGRDTIQLIQWRYFMVAGPGYRWWEEGENRYFDTRVGLGYLHQEYLTANVGDETTPNTTEDTRDDLTANFGYEYSNVIAERLELLHTAGLLVPVLSADEFIVTTELIASVPIVLGWAFRNTVALEYQNEPADDADDTNIRYTMGLEYSF